MFKLIITLFIFSSLSIGCNDSKETQPAKSSNTKPTKKNLSKEAQNLVSAVTAFEMINLPREGCKSEKTLKKSSSKKDTYSYLVSCNSVIAYNNGDYNNETLDISGSQLKSMVNYKEVINNALSNSEVRNSGFLAKELRLKRDMSEDSSQTIQNVVSKLERLKKKKAEDFITYNNLISNLSAVGFKFIWNDTSVKTKTDDIDHLTDIQKYHVFKSIVDNLNTLEKTSPSLEKNSFEFKRDKSMVERVKTEASLSKKVKNLYHAQEELYFVKGQLAVFQGSIDFTKNILEIATEMNKQKNWKVVKCIYTDKGIFKTTTTIIELSSGDFSAGAEMKIFTDENADESINFGWRKTSKNQEKSHYIAVDSYLSSKLPFLKKSHKKTVSFKVNKDDLSKVSFETVLNKNQSKKTSDQLDCEVSNYK